MSITAELADGRRLEFPDGTDPAVIQSTVKRVISEGKTKEVTTSGVAVEAGKGLLRGASDTAMSVAGGVTRMLGPVVGPLAEQGIRAVAQPSRDLVQARPENEAERFAGTASEIVGAGAAGGGMNTVRNALVNTAAGLTGATGEQIGGEVGKVVGTVIPAVANAATTAARSTVSKVPENLAEFNRVGSTPSVGQATESAFFRGLENLISKFPGGVGVMERFTQNQQSTLGARASTGTTAAQAGRAIESGITGQGGFLARTKEVWQKLDDQLGAKMEAAPQLAPTNTQKALNLLTAEVPGAEKTTGALANPKLLEISKNLAEDLQANGGVIPFEALRALRTRVGSMMENSLVSGVPGGELKKLYSGLSKDMEAAAEAAGAGKEFARQSNYYAARMDRIEGVLDRVLGQNRMPEDIFKLVNPSNPDQASKLTAVMRSLRTEERQTVTNAVVERLGKAAPGRQDAAGDVFSSETFLTNWNKMSPAARIQLFPDAEVRRSIESLATASENIRQGSKVFQNPSGTAGSFAAYSVYSAPISAMAAGAAAGGPAAGAVLLSATGAAGSAWGSARMLTSPTVVKWLADFAKAPNQSIAPHLARLGVIYENTKDPDLKQDLAQFINVIGTQRQQR